MKWLVSDFLGLFTNHRILVPFFPSRGSRDYPYKELFRGAVLKKNYLPWNLMRRDSERNLQHVKCAGDVRDLGDRQWMHKNDFYI